MKRLAIIPARAGSKRLKDKNITDLCGRPLIAYTIEAAIDSELFDKVVVSTDSELYADISKSYGADILMRGESLSNDTATSFMVIKDALSKCDDSYDYFVLLQPTSPLRSSTHIKEAVQRFEENIKKFDFLVSMKESEHPKALCNPIEDDMSLKFFDSDFSSYRRQAFKDYAPNGAIFIARPDAYLSQKHFFGSKAMAYIMNAEDSIDIDNAIDLALAKAVLEMRHQNL